MKRRKKSGSSFFIEHICGNGIRSWWIPKLKIWSSDRHMCSNLECNIHSFRHCKNLKSALRNLAIAPKKAVLYASWKVNHGKYRREVEYRVIENSKG